jgi:hypothetical protein
LYKICPAASILPQVEKTRLKREDLTFLQLELGPAEMIQPPSEQLNPQLKKRRHKTQLDPSSKRLSVFKSIRPTHKQKLSHKRENSAPKLLNYVTMKHNEKI